MPSRDGECSASLGNLCQCRVTLTEKVFHSSMKTVPPNFSISLIANIQKVINISFSKNSQRTSLGFHRYNTLKFCMRFVLQAIKIWFVLVIKQKSLSLEVFCTVPGAQSRVSLYFRDIFIYFIYSYTLGG